MDTVKFRHMNRIQWQQFFFASSSLNIMVLYGTVMFRYRSHNPFYPYEMNQSFFHPDYNTVLYVYMHVCMFVTGNIYDDKNTK